MELLPRQLLPDLQGGPERLRDPADRRPAGDDDPPRVHPSGASWTTHGRTARRAIRSTTGACTEIGDWVFVGTLLVIALTGFVLEGVRIAMSRPGLRRHPVRRLDRRPGADRARATRRSRGCATACGGSTACSRSRSSRASRTRRPRTCCRATSSLSLRDPLAGQAACARSRPTAPRSRPATARSPTSARCTCSSSTPARSAAGATRRARPTRPGRPLSPRDVILELREQPHPADGRSGIGGVLGRVGRRQGRRRRFHRERDRRGRRPHRDGVVVHAVQRVRRDLPGRDRAGADHQPAAPAAGRGGRARLQPAVDARGDPQVRELVRREQAPARALDQGARLRGPGRPQAAGRRAVVRRRLRVVRSRARSRSPARWRACCTRPGSTSGSSTTASATPATTCAGSGEEGLFETLAEQNIATLAGCEFEPDRHQRPALAQHAAQRVPRRSAASWRCCTTRRCCWS